MSHLDSWEFRICEQTDSEDTPDASGAMDTDGAYGIIHVESKQPLGGTGPMSPGITPRYSKDLGFLDSKTVKKYR